MTAGRQESLVKAAVALRLATPAKSADRVTVAGQEWDIATWRDQRNNDFSRACEALFTVEQLARPQPAAAAASPSLLATITPFLVAFVTATVTVLATSWRDKIARGKLQADALLTSVGEFLVTSERYLTGWTGTGSQPDDAPIREQRARILEKLAPVGTLHPSWKAVERVRDQMRTGPFGPDLTTGWVRLDAKARAVRIEGLQAQLETMNHTIGQVTRGLARPIRSYFAQPATTAAVTS